MELVYFLSAEHTNLVKIGWTSNIVQRLRKLRLACPHDVRLIGVRPGTKDLETGYHEHFSSVRQHAEWFNFDYQTQTWMQAALRGQYAEAWAEVERLFNEQAPELLRIEDRFGSVSSILVPCAMDVDEATPRRIRRIPVAVRRESEVGDE